jgi:alpha-glucosidase
MRGCDCQMVVLDYFRRTKMNRKVSLMKTVEFLQLSLLFVCVSNVHSFAQSSYDLRSPDGRIEVRIRTAGQIRYDIVVKGRAVLENSTLSLDVEHKRLGLQPKVIDAQPRSHDEVVEPAVRQKFAKIRDHYNELKLNMEGGYAVIRRRIGL